MAKPNNMQGVGNMQQLNDNIIFWKLEMKMQA
jgi:hypothetical protein